MNKINKFNPQARRNARRLALQAIYQWQITAQSLSELQLQFQHDEKISQADEAYFHDLIKAITQQYDLLDKELQPHLDRSMSELDPIEHAILRIGAYELTQRLEVPYRVILNEAVELAKLFGADDGFKYVNGILDKLASKVRITEKATK